jgi:NAD(P)H-hydrate epimerase
MASLFLTREQVRQVDRRAIDELGIPGAVLMENAGRGAAELLVALGLRGRVVICCGKGNNGGDGFVMARHLANRGAGVRVLLFAPPNELTGDAALHFHGLPGLAVPVVGYARQPLDELALRRELGSAEWIVDALFGTGLSGGLRTPFNQVVAAVNASGRRVLAVDIPSGLDCDTGRPLGPAVRASHTATFVALKKGFADPAAREWLGQVHVLDIGVPSSLVTESMGVPP